MAWIRDTGEPVRRRPVDAVRLILGVAGVAVAGIWAQSGKLVDAEFFKVINDLPADLDGLGKAIFALGTVWAVLAATVLLLLLRQRRAAVRVIVAGVGAWALGMLLNHALGQQSVQGIDAHVRTADGPVYPSVAVAVVTALTVAVAPFIVRPLRRLLVLLIVLVGVAAMYLGAAFPSDVLGGLLLGLAAGAAALVVLGSPAGRPSEDEVRDSLTALGYDVAEVTSAPEASTAGGVMDVILASGRRLRVDVFGRDERDGEFAARVGRWLITRQPGNPIFGGRVQRVEHIAYILLLADRAHIRAPRLEKTGVGTNESAVLVTVPPDGTPLEAIEAADLTDAALTEVWGAVGRLHDAGISHGNLDGRSVLIGSDGDIALENFSEAAINADAYWRDRDVVALLTDTAARVGNERAVAVAVDALGRDRIAEVLPVVQPAVLPSRTLKQTKHAGKILRALRTDLATATGVEDVKPLKIRRLSWTDIGMTIGMLVALAIAIPQLTDISSLGASFKNATWAWAVAALCLYPLVPATWTTAIIGAVNLNPPFGITYVTQIASTFLNLITPNGIGGTALQIDYLHRKGAPTASATGAVILNSTIGTIIQGILLISCVAVTASSLNFDHQSDPAAILGIVALAIAAVGLLLLLPKVRGKVVPHVKRAVSDLWAVTKNPQKALRLLGGSLAGNLLMPTILGLSLLVFGAHLSFAQLVVVQLGAGMVSTAAPVPGGIGVAEASLTALLTAYGVADSTAVSAVLVYRTITFAIPPVFGFFCLRWLRARGEV